MTREQVIKELQESHDIMRSYDIDESESRLMTALNMAIKALEQEPILDKIRVEIEQEYTKFRNKSDMWNERACGLGTALEIIDKYKTETEQADGQD